MFFLDKQGKIITHSKTPKLLLDFKLHGLL